MLQKVMFDRGVVTTFLLQLLIGLAFPVLAQGATTATLADFTLNGRPYVRLELRYVGPYRLTGHELREAGVPLEEVEVRKLALYNGGRALPLRITGSKKGHLSDDAHLDFITSRLDAYRATDREDNLADVHLLTWDGITTGLHYKQAQPDAGTPATEVAFRSYSVRERDSFFQYTPLRKETDGFFWHSFSAGSDSKSTRINLTFPGFKDVPSEPVRLSARFFGATNVAGLKPQHSFDFMYDAISLGRMEFDGIAMHDFQTSIPPNVLQPRASINLATPPDRQDAVDRVYLDRVSVRYPRSLNAESKDFFHFNNQYLSRDSISSGVLISGLIEGSTIFAVENATYYSVTSGTSFALPLADAPTSYVAVSKHGYQPVDHVSYRPPDTSLSSVHPETEALILSHPALATASTTYANYRKSKGMKIKHALVTDVFDNFSHGFISDTALKQYVQYVFSLSPNLKYVVLFGDSTYDYREARNFAEDPAPRILLPIHWVHNPATAWSGGYQDDNWYGSLAEEYRPDLAVGRIPAASEHEAIEYVRKVIEFEVLKHGKNDKALFVSSVEKSFQDLVSDVSTKYQDTFSTSTILFPETATATREVQRMQDEISSGVKLLYYLGHGGSMVWRVGPTDFALQKDLFTPKEANLLNNWGRYPIVACSSCYTTSFDQKNSLGEALLLRPAGGAIAMFGSPWKATVYESHSFNTKVFKYMFEEKVKRLGDALLLAHRELTPPGVSTPSYQSFTLLGDPCLEMQ